MHHSGWQLRSTIIAFVLGCTAVAAHPSGGPSAFSIDRFMQAPYPSALVAAPNEPAAAWVFNTRGVRNIWIADATKMITSRSITNFTLDDGYDIGELAWSPDAQTIAFVRGQTLEDDGPANVLSAPEGPSSRGIWLVPVAGGEARMIGQGRAPSFAPDGKSLVFIDKHKILTFSPGSDQTPRTLLTDFGVVRSPTWSSDGKRLAFVSERGDHALVGIYDIAARTITWMAPSFDFDGQPAFSPDCRQVAFIRIRTEKSQPFVSRRAGLPWSIWIADAATGLGHPAWTADAGAGSVFRPTLSSANLLWTADGYLVFPWEKTGWLLPYVVAATGGVARPLAQGEFEVAYVTPDKNRRGIVLASNEGDIDRLHVWTADAAGGSAVAVIAHDDGIEAYPSVAPDGTIFALRSDAKTQLAPVVLRAGHWRSLVEASISASFPSSEMVVPRSVMFKADDALTVHGQLFLPPKRFVGRRPTIMFFHGGPSRQMLTGFHYMSAYSYMYGLNEYFASKGYVVLSVNYRGGIGYGLDYREAKAFGPAGGSEIHDLMGAISYLQERSDVDASHIGIWGGSYGGLMTALGLARASNSIAVGVDYAGVYDWASMLKTDGAPIEDERAKAVAIASSPIATIDKWHSPVLVVQADDDRNVPIQQSSQLIQDLQAHGVEHETILMPNEVHDLTRYASWMQLFEATDRYLSRYLEPGKLDSKASY